MRALTALLILLAAAPCLAEEPKPETVPTPDHQILVYYFMSNPRCRTCRNIEDYTAQTVKRSFIEERALGKLRWEVVDTDRSENKHFTDDFALYTKAVVLVEQKGEQRVRWKNLDQIWKKVGDRDEFEEYIRTEIRQFLKALDG